MSKTRIILSLLFIGSMVWLGMKSTQPRHFHEKVPVYYNSGKIKVVYTICGDTAKVHANGNHYKLNKFLYLIDV